MKQKQSSEKELKYEYVFMDTDSWLNLLIPKLEERNPIEFIVEWIKRGYFKILLPYTNRLEWNRKKNDKKKEVISALKNLTNYHENVLTTSSNDERIKKLEFEQIIEKRINIIEGIFNDYSIRIPINRSVLLEAGIRNLKCISPNHGKDSYRDTVNMLYVFDYIRKNNIESTAFVTNNWSDYSQNKNNKGILNDGLTAEFNKLGIGYFCPFESFFHQIKKKLPGISEYQTKQLAHKKGNSQVNLNSLDEMDFANEEFIDDIEYLDKLLTRSKLSKDQIIFTITLINSNDVYYDYFFRKVRNKLWLKILIDNGFFEPDEIPKTVQVGDGFQLPNWGALQYLLRISETIKAGEYFELTEEVIKIVEKISKTETDNFRVWTSIIEIISNLPNESIDVELLKYIPKWTKSRFRIASTSSAVCEKLLPKFLKNNPSREDNEKALVILKEILSLHRIEDETGVAEYHFGINYFPIIDLYYLKHTLINNNLIKSISKNLDLSFFSFLANQVNKLIINDPYFFTIDKINGKCKMRLLLEDRDLVVKYYDYASGKSDTKEIKDYQKLDKPEVTNKIIEFIKSWNSSDKNIYEDKADIEWKIKPFYFVYTRTWCESFHKFNPGYIYAENIKEIFVFILFKFLVYKTEFAPKQAQESVKELLDDEKYRQPLFKRLALYMISENWNEGFKNIFWNWMKNREAEIFSEYEYEKDIFYFLKKNCKEFKERELEVFKEIINNKILIKDNKSKKYKEVLQLKYSGALQCHKTFENLYTKLKNKLGYSIEKYEDEGKANISYESESPFYADQISEMNNEELVQKIENYRKQNKDDLLFYDGLKDAIASSVSEHPNIRFKDLDKLIDIDYIYLSSIIRGFRIAWENKKSINWEKVLDFCNKLIGNEQNLEFNKTSENKNHVTVKNWLMVAIANLIESGTKNDNNAFEPEYLDSAKKILVKISENVQNAEDGVEESNINYITYTLNSTYGKIITAIINYALRKARVEEKETGKQNWDLEIKKIYEKFLNEKVIDSYIILGWFFPQIFYLDEKWLYQTVKKCYNYEDQYQNAFIGGLLRNRVFIDDDIYNLLKPLYQKALNSIKKFSKIDQEKIVQHITLLYLYGKIRITKNSLIYNVLHKTSIGNINDLVSFLWTHKKHIMERKGQRKKVFDLWNYILRLYPSPKNTEEEVLYSEMTKLLAYMDKLNKHNYDLIKKIIPFVDKNYQTIFLIENLTSLIGTIRKDYAVKYIADILILFINYNPNAHFDRKAMQGLFEFILTNKKYPGIENKIIEMKNAFFKAGHYWVKDL